MIGINRLSLQVMNDVYKIYFKRSIDILFCILLTVLISWLILIIIFIYSITFQFPVLFVQERIGLNEKTFKLLKFRTLKPNGSSLDARRFWLGDFLRLTSLDELPQLINIIKGEMSLIGPRPLPVEYLPLFTSMQRERHSIKPGITGWAQVNGRHSIEWNKKFELDIFYVNNLSFWLDLKIIVKTFLLVLSFRKDTSLQEQKFTGSNHA